MSNEKVADARIGITERGDAAHDLTWIPWLAEGKPAILITKDPATLFGVLQERELLARNYIVHATITGYGGTKVEPGVPFASSAIHGLESFICRIDWERTVLRVDPIIPTNKGTECALELITEILNRGLMPETLRISFLDNYKHIKPRFVAAGFKSLPYDFHAPLEKRKEIFDCIADLVGDATVIEVCGEPGFDCVGCVSWRDCNVLGIKDRLQGTRQRAVCACLANKYELLKERKQCKHGCIYCYWK